MDLASLLELMLAKRVLRVRLADGTEAELHPSAFERAPVAPAAEPVETPDEDRCPGCTHLLSVEHNELGCLLGCADEVCAAKTAPVQEAAE